MSTETNYQQQATDFLKATGTKFSAKFKHYGYHFDEDKDSRDVFSCVLSNSKHRYRFNFGQSLNDSTGSGDNPPTAYDVLAGMTKYEINTFEDFCSEYGYDTDSRKAYKTYKAVIREWKNVEKLFTPEQIELLQEIN